MNKITWTFPANSDPRTAGKTYSGVPDTINGVEVVNFGVHGNIRILAKVEGRPELIAAVAAYKAQMLKAAPCGCGSYNSRCTVETLDCGCKLHRRSVSIDGEYQRDARKDWTDACKLHAAPAERKGRGWCSRCESYCYGDCAAN
jgi:hypothetical protein